MRLPVQPPRPELNRRSFLKWSAALGAGTALGGWGLRAGGGLSDTALAQNSTGPITVMPQMCTYNCGGYSCFLNLEVQDGVIVRADTDQEDRPGAPAMRACLRGRSVRKFVYHPDRLKTPMKRVGKRGEGKFEPISWDEAYQTIADNLSRIIKQYGNEAVYYMYASGVDGFGRGVLNRLLYMMGGYTTYYGTYSSACYGFAAPYTYGAVQTNTSDDLQNAKLVVSFAGNSAETQNGGGNEFYWQMQAKKKGVKFIVVDPRLSDSAKVLADEWIPIRPTTDNALFDAMAYVMIMENLQDQAFLDKYCIGFDEEHMPAGAPKNASYRSYVMGSSADKTVKTPEWAEKITGIPKETIVRLAREIATSKPCALIQNLGFQRAAYGEQPVRGLPVLAAMTGNVGISGGGPGLRDGRRSSLSPSIPAGSNPVKAQISVFMWPEAITRGTEFTPNREGLRGVEKMKSNLKFIWNYGGNTLINQHSDCNGTHKILEDDTKLEFLVVHDIFMTPSAKYADILLPDATFVERLHTGRGSPNVMGDRFYYGAPAIKPLFESRDVYTVCSGVAEKLGIKEKYTEGKTWEQWVHQSLATVREKNPSFPTVEELKKDPVVRGGNTAPTIAYAAFIKDPVKNKLTTPSGKIEIYSERLAKMGNDRGIPDLIPPIPKYIPAWEGPEDPLREKYPIQCVGHHTKRRVHSTHDNNPWMEEVEPQRVWINELDADQRGIKDWDLVKVWNDRGVIHIPAFVTRTIMPGVASIPQGAWYTPNKDGVDTRGNVNTITKYHPTPGAKGNPQHTNLVQIAKL